jgi:putative PIN family toxin of toxin-antitoxin system
MTAPRPAVFDCNVFLQSMLSARGASHACWQKVATQEVELFVTPYILAEIRRLPSHRSLKRFSTFTPERVERFVEELIDVAELVADPASVFIYPRDPKDAHYVDLAVATDSLLIVSNDKDLLDLMNDTNGEGKALRLLHPDFRVLTPPELLQTIRER